MTFQNLISGFCFVGGKHYSVKTDFVVKTTSECIKLPFGQKSISIREKAITVSVNAIVAEG